MCPTGVPADHCIPMCEAKTNGYLLLLNLDGEDTKLTCELHHLLYSWIGGAADGGYIAGAIADTQAFFSAVVSGAAGFYLATLLSDAGISTDLTIQPGQSVVVSGDQSLAAAPAWGTGGFSVRQFGSLSLVYVRLDAVSSAFGSVSPSVGLSCLPACCLSSL